jgi:hypothetical protein
MDLHAAILARGSRGDCVGVDKFGTGPEICPGLVQVENGDERWHRLIILLDAIDVTYM